MNKQNRDNAKKKLWEKQEGRCYYCERLTRLCSPEQGEKGDVDMATLDHVVPKSRLKKKKIRYLHNNLVIACNECNQRKGSMRETRFRELLRLERKAVEGGNRHADGPREQHDAASA